MCDVMAKPNNLNKTTGMPFLIAEIGINHNGDIKVAKQLVDMAVRCGCDAVKFQKRTVDLVYSKKFLDSPRQSPWGSTQRDQKFGLEFSLSDYEEIDIYCKRLGIEWFASCWDLNSLNVMSGNFDWRFNKVASAMATNLEFCEEVAKLGKHTFISTAGCDWGDVIELGYLFRNNNTPFTWMHCVGLYPCPTNLLNMNVISEFKNTLGVSENSVGYSGHSSGIMDGVIAAILGASAIEKHITLDRTMYGSDQSASLEEPGLRKMVEYIQYVTEAMGDGVKTITPEEQKVMDKLRYWE